MPSMKTIKRRLSSVTSTQKIMKAMNMVAASTLQKNMLRLEAAKAFSDEVEKVLSELKQYEAAAGSIFAKPREVKNTAYLVITSNRGLCGGYNTNVASMALEHMNKDRNEMLLLVGTKGQDFFKKHDKNVAVHFTALPESATYEDAEHISSYLSLLYTAGAADVVYAAYTEFESILTYEPKLVRLLPIDLLPNDAIDAADGGDEAPREPDDMVYDIGISTFVDHAASMHLSAFVYTALLESSACEQASRMVNMDAAVSNASDIIDRLTRQINRRRQASITEEIIEIVSTTGASSKD